MMVSGICCKQALALPREIDFVQAARYYGVRGRDEDAEALLRRLAPQILSAAVPRMVWAEFGIQGQRGLLAGQDIAAHLTGCDAFVLLGVTLGSGVDAAIRCAGIADVAAQAAADALASALAEQVCEEAEQTLRSLFQEKGRCMTGRFSPGYGDWPISVQKQIGRLLDLPRQIGVTVTDTYLMLPRKSVTAALGVANHPVNGKRAGCAHCALRAQCEYRKRGQTCESNGTVSTK